MNTIPTTIVALVAQSTRAIDAAKELEDDLELEANTAENIGTDHYGFIGRAADPTATPPVAAIIGKHPAYVDARAAHALARANYRVARKAARDFMAQAVDTLKGKLGRRWNSQWNAVGFTNGSLALPTDPVAVLDLIAAHFRAHADHEATGLGLTAANAELKKNAFVAAQGTKDTAHMAETLAKQARDSALKKLRHRMTLLREELNGVLSRDDARWYRFGFRRPVDGRTPDLVSELTLELGAPGQVIATWSKARLAVNYRVSWKVTGSTADPTEVGLFGDPQTVINGLPHGANITVIVTARNAAGESAPMEAAIAVP